MAHDISSTKNPKIREILALQKSKERKKTGLVVVEGRREISMALQAGHKLHSLLVCPEVFTQNPYYPIDLTIKIPTYTVSREVFAHLAYREGVEGIIALFQLQLNPVEFWQLTKNPLLLIVENVEKPGNLGAMLRTADAAGVDGVIICQPDLDLSNPNIIRSSLGCLFTLQVSVMDNPSCLRFLNERKISTFAATLSTISKVYTSCSFDTPTAIIVGSEAHGLSEFWLNNASHQIIIPMKGQIDSLNVSNAAAILLYEVIRQRSTVHK